MNAEVSKGLERALRAAANGAGTAEGSGVPNDPISLLMKLAPALLESTEEREALIELQKESIAELHKELQYVRLQMRALVRSHKRVREQLHLMNELQSALVGHLARVQIIEAPGDEDLDEAFDEMLADEQEDEALLAARSELEKQRRRGVSRAPQGKGPPRARPRRP